jgi:hypothetical protein
MQSVLVWVGSANHASLLGHVSKVNEIKVFSQLGGGYVGSINLLANQDDESKVLISMQRQIAKLMPHNLRDSRDVVIYAGHVRLTPPDFGYTFKPYKDFTSRLGEAIKAKKVEVKYDEADEHAMQVVQGLCLSITPGIDDDGLDCHVVTVNVRNVAPHELRALPHHYVNIIGMSVHPCDLTQDKLVDMSVLSNIPSIRWCTFRGVFPSEWSHLRNLTFTRLIVTPGAFAIPDELVNLPKLEELCVEGPATNLPQSLGNLKRLHLKFTTLCFPDLLRSLLNTPSITKLVLEHNYFDFKGVNTIPSEFGNLTNLRELRMTRNKFTGSIPKEIGQLTNLKTLHVLEAHEGLGPIAALHPSILALNIPDLRVECMR